MKAKILLPIYQWCIQHAQVGGKNGNKKNESSISCQEKLQRHRFTVNLCLVYGQCQGKKKHRWIWLIVLCLFLESVKLRSVSI